MVWSTYICSLRGIYSHSFFVHFPGCFFPEEDAANIRCRSFLGVYCPVLQCCSFPHSPYFLALSNSCSSSSSSFVSVLLLPFHSFFFPTLLHFSITQSSQSPGPVLQRMRITASSAVHTAVKDSAVAIRVAGLTVPQMTSSCHSVNAYLLVTCSLPLAGDSQPM